MSHPTSESATSRAIACTLGPDQLATQVERWTNLYAEAGIERLVTDNGLRVSFRPDPTVDEELRALVAVEAVCCGWARWSIGARPDGLFLEITSTGDGITVIHSWLLNEDLVAP